MAREIGDLRRRVLLVGTPIAVLAVALTAYLADQAAQRQFQRAQAAGLESVAGRAAGMVNEYVRARIGDLRLIALTPGIVEAAAASGRQADQQGLGRLAVPELEQRYAATKRLINDPALVNYLVRVREATDFAEIFFTERNGLTVTGTNPTSDFVQSDEEWWQRGFLDGEFQGEATFDESAGTAAFEVSVQLADPRTGDPLGVIKGVVQLSRLARIMALSDRQAGMGIEVVDSTVRVIVSRDEGRLLSILPERGAVPRSAATEFTILRPGTDDAELLASAPANGGRWWVLVRERLDTAYAAAGTIRTTVWVAAAAVLVIVLAAIFWVTDWLNRQVTQPVRSAGHVARRIADGDLSVSVAEEGGGSDEVTQLLGSVQTMVSALRSLVGRIRTASEESAAMAEEISASTQQMSASTQEMANTCQNLSGHATDQAAMVRAAASDAGRILDIATHLADGAKVAAQRNAALKDVAESHRHRLMEGSAQLGTLANDLERGAADAERLAGLSEEIQKFVTQARTIASQTNMLALNAAIEASRGGGGGEGRGFAVVADEVRKLANQAARAAATTSQTVTAVLETVQDIRTRLARLAEASASVREIAEAAAGALKEVAGGAAETSAWTGEISGAAGNVRGLVQEISERLETIAQGTESVVSAAEEIAASAQQQSASTEEIAGSAARLAEAAEGLTAAVSSFRLAGSRPRPGPSRSAAA